MRALLYTEDHFTNLIRAITNNALLSRDKELLNVVRIRVPFYRVSAVRTLVQKHCPISIKPVIERLSFREHFIVRGVRWVI